MSESDAGDCSNPITTADLNLCSHMFLLEWKLPMCALIHLSLAAVTLLILKMCK